jgi:hypothetical protein
MPSFEYEPLALFLEPKTLDEEEDIGDTNGVRPSSTRVAKELGDLMGGKDSPEKEAIEQTLK